MTWDSPRSRIVPGGAAPSNGPSNENVDPGLDFPDRAEISKEYTDPNLDLAESIESVDPNLDFAELLLQNCVLVDPKRLRPDRPLPMRPASGSQITRRRDLKLDSPFSFAFSWSRHVQYLGRT